MRKFFLSGCIGVPIIVGGYALSDTFFVGYFSCFIYVFLDGCFIQGIKA